MNMAQETRNVDYESMVEKYMNEWERCNLREFSLEFSDAKGCDDVDEGKA